MIGFIGAGNMGSAIIKGMLSNNIPKELIYASAKTEETQNRLALSGINVCTKNIEVIHNCKYVFLAVKPYIYDMVLNEINDYLSEDHVIIIMAAGYNIGKVKTITGNRKVVRIMPNTPALVGSGFTVVCYDELISRVEKEQLENYFKTFGDIKEINESLINAYSALTGSSPAFVSILIEAMADAGVLMGIPRKDAYMAAECTIAGTAKLAAISDLHPGQLKDMVCSPGGTSIEGIRTLEEKGFRSSIIEALINTYKKNLDLSKIR